MRISRSAYFCAGIVIVAAIGHHWLLLSGRATQRTERIPLAVPLETLPLELGAWRGQDLPLPDDVVRTAGATTYLNRQYTAPDGGAIGLYIAYYAHVMDRVPHGPTICLPYHGWEKKSEEVVSLPTAASGYSGLQAMKLLYEKEPFQMVFFYWHAANGRQLVAKRDMYTDSAWTRFKGLFGLGGGYLVQVSVSTIVTGSTDKAFERVERFFKENFPTIAEHFPKTDDPREGTTDAPN